MASSVVVHGLSCLSLYSRKPYKTQTLALPTSQFLPSFKTKTQSLFIPSLQLRNPRTRNPRSILVVSAVQSNFLKVIQTVWKVGKDGIEAGTNLVPDSVPRPIARIGLTVIALAIALYVLKSFISTAFFVLATMGLVYFVFIALNKDQGPRGGGGGGGGEGTDSSEDPLEEARRIMEKYK